VRMNWITYGAPHMGVRLKALSHLALITVAFAGCTTVMYGGPRRASNKIAVLSTSGGARVVRLDGQTVKGGTWAKYEVLPGRHSVELSGYTTEHKIYVTVIRHSKPIEACFIADPGHVYQATTSPDEEGVWQREIREEDADQDVSFDCSDRPAVPRN
jgi:hypothetical protein